MIPETKSETARLGASVSSDAPSVASLVRLIPELLAELRRLRVSRHDAEDAVQLALIRGAQWLQTGRMHDLKDPHAWLRTVAVNAARTIARRRKWSALSDADTPCVTPPDDLEREEEQRVRLSASLAELARLRADLRELFVYCKMGGHSIRDAALKFGLPVGTVGGRLAKAILMLRASLRAQGFDIPEDHKTRRRGAHRASARVLKVNAAPNNEGRDLHGYGLSEVPQK